MRRAPQPSLSGAVLASFFIFGVVACASARLVVLPERLELTGADPIHGIVVMKASENGQMEDVTGKVTIETATPNVVAITKDRRCTAVADGSGVVRVTYGVDSAEIAVTCTRIADQPVPSFRQDVLPILTTTGCNAGGCHGKQAGQNGFRLSLRGYAPEWDHDWITTEVNGRRINAAFPEQSLLVQKAVNTVAHEGGTRFRKGTRYYDTMVRWIAGRTPGPISDERDAARLEVLPGDRLMKAGETQQLLVRAHYENGRTRDVTWLAQFFSNDETVVVVKPSGLAKAVRNGETSVRVHFQGLVEVVRFTMPHDAPVDAEQFVATQNAIDEPVFRKLAALHIPPSPPAADETFIRRATLDATGTLPTAEEVEAFVADSTPDKRARLVDSLLARPEWVDFWTLQLADLLQNRKERDHDVRGIKGVRSFHAWLREQVAANRPWDQLARAVLLARGNTIDQPEIGYYITVAGEKERLEESELPDSVAQSFLGTRVGCARCHNHPLEKYTQDDFYHFAAYFSKMSLSRVAPAKGATELLTISREERNAAKRLEEAEAKLAELLSAETPEGEEPAKKIRERERDVEEARKRIAEAKAKAPSVNQPRTGKQMDPRPLDGGKWVHEAGRDPREQFVETMLASENFAGAMVNRLWKHFFSVGLVEPVDDLRASNPPSNPELWSLLIKEFSAHGYDLKHVMRLILNSRAYQLSSQTVEGNQTDSRFFSHYYARRLPAEVLLDGITAATGIPSPFKGYPLGTRATQLPEPGVGSYFLTVFGRSERVTACACERSGDVTLPQLLHLKNSDELQKQIASSEGLLAELLKAQDDIHVTEQLFLTALGRKPREGESTAVKAALSGDNREAVFRDLLWALINSKEFAFNY